MTMPASTVLDSAAPGREHPRGADGTTQGARRGPGVLSRRRRAGSRSGRVRFLSGVAQGGLRRRDALPPRQEKAYEHPSSVLPTVRSVLMLR